MHEERPRILFAVPDGDTYARVFVELARSIPEAECRFVGFSWSAGGPIRRLGFPYAFVPLGARSAHSREVLPRLAEFAAVAESPGEVPAAARAAYRLLVEAVAAAIDAFAPGLVVFGPVDHAIGFAMAKASAELRIPSLGFQPCHLAGHYFVHGGGVRWMEQLHHSAQGDGAAPSGPDGKDRRRAEARSTTTKRRSPWAGHYFVRGAEEVARLVAGGPRFHSAATLASRARHHLAPRRWLPSLPTLEAVAQLRPRCVMAALHQPALGSWGDPRWEELVSFGLDATPEEWTLVVRPHPAEPYRALPKSIEARLRARSALVSRPGRGPSLGEILKRCELLVTISSSAGFEALLAGVPVLTLAPAFYSRPGLSSVASLRDAEATRTRLETAAIPRPDPRVVVAFEERLLATCIVPTPLRDGVAKEALANRVRALIGAGSAGQAWAR